MSPENKNGRPHRRKIAFDYDEYIRLYRQGLSNKNIAEALGMNQRTLYRRLCDERNGKY